jgi:hypothetical protein
MKRTPEESISTSMSPEAWNKEDDFILHLYSPEDPLVRGFEGLEQVLALIETMDEELRPDRMYLTKRPQKYSRRTLRERFHENRVGTGTGTILARSRPPEVSVWLNTYDGSVESVRFALKLWINPFSFVRQPEKASALAGQFVSLVRALAARLPLSYGMGHSFTDFTMTRKPDAERVSVPRQISEAFWLNVYGPSIVEDLGRDRVLSTPASLMEELPGGAVLWLTRPTPADFDSEEARTAQARALIHLRPELSMETTLTTLRERSQVFVPIPLQFHPDVAEIIQKEVEFRGLLRKRQEVERFNRYQPPAVSEWLPAQQAPAPDVADMKAAVDTYEGLHAEQLIALFHKEEPQVLQTIPEALPALDWRLWHFGWGEELSADKKAALIPALGAWLGRYLVYKLGGRWVPRREFTETAVVIGDRAWLPFLRARHALESRNAPLDFSCTQFFREAQRHARVPSP